MLMGAVQKVLLLEDDQDLRATLVYGLEAAGYEVKPAADGRDVLKMIDDFAPDVIVTDVIMPHKEGIETIQEVRSVKPNLPIVAMSGGGRMNADDILRFAAAFGVQQTIAKPFKIKDLVDAVEAAFNKA